MNRLISLLILTLAFASVALAQTQTPPAPGFGQRQGGQRSGGLGIATPPGNRAVTLEAVSTYTVTTAWWSNAALVTRLGLTDVQKTRIEATFEAHRQGLVSSKEQLEKEEAQLAKLLDAESVDRSSIFTQINRVIQARGEMERTSATMTLEMREQLTRAQWAELQASQPRLMVRLPSEQLSLPVLIQQAPATAPAPGARGQRGGGAPQP